MAQDIRDMFERERNRPSANPSAGHEDRFLQKLEQALPQERNRRIVPIWLRFAAASVALVCLTYIAYSLLNASPASQQQPGTIVEQSSPDGASVRPQEALVPTSPVKKDELELTPQLKEKKAVVKQNVSPREPLKKRNLTLADISPDLKKVEAFFISSINIELANLEAGPEEQAMVNAYLIKVKELGHEYEKLTKELNTIGVNEMTISALIENLKLRLQLLQRLKKNLNYLKNGNNEKDSSNNI